MKKVVCIAVLSGCFFTTADGLRAIKQSVASTSSLLKRSQHLSSVTEATSLLSEIRTIRAQPFTTADCRSKILNPAEANCNSFLNQQKASQAKQIQSNTVQTPIAHKPSNNVAHPQPKPQVTHVPAQPFVAPVNNQTFVPTAVPPRVVQPAPVQPQIPVKPVMHQPIFTPTVVPPRVTQPAPVQPQAPMKPVVHQPTVTQLAPKINAVNNNQPPKVNAVNPQPTKPATTALPTMQKPHNNTQNTQTAADHVKSVWQNVSPVVRYPIEAGIKGVSYLYSVNKPAAVAACVGAAGVVAFLAWAENKCLTTYDSVFCNPFSSPSFGQRAAQFLGI